MTTVLIIEDDSWLAAQQKSLLEKEGYVAHVSPHALAAVEAVDALHPDCIIIDILLPGTTGFALLHELQSYPDTGSIPIIVCSTLAPEVRLEEVSQYGVKRLLDKATMTPVDLVAAVRSVL